jgi:NDP-mannose synthase
MRLQAVVLAGGKGTRLKPYTAVFPKPLVPLGDMPVLELILRQLKRHGFEEVILAVGHLAELIQAYFGDGSKWGLRLRYSFEDQPRGTIGPLAYIEDLADDVLVMNGDIVSDLSYSELVAQHCQQQALATLALHVQTTQIAFGVLDVNSTTLAIESFKEKPTLTHHVSMGIHVFSKRLLQQVPQGQLYGLDHLMSDILEGRMKGLEGLANPLQAFPFEGYWLDIGRHSDYQSALSEFELMKQRLLPETALETRLPVVAPLQPVHIVHKGLHPMPMWQQSLQAGETAASLLANKPVDLLKQQTWQLFSGLPLQKGLAFKPFNKAVSIQEPIAVIKKEQAI